MIWALVLGTVLAVGTLAFVLYPLFFGVTRPPVVSVIPRLNEGESAVAALREIEFDRATGKLSETDYAELKTRYTREAIAAMRRKDSGVANGSTSVDDEVEVAVRAYREQHPVCEVHGPRPEADAVYCSDCGRYLHDRCAGCGAPVVEHDARYCVTCGVRLAA
ncbi:MAG TPA: zinc ribbon domain-containing protein [Gemmatimonadaceae bacterium]